MLNQPKKRLSGGYAMFTVLILTMVMFILAGTIVNKMKTDSDFNNIDLSLKQSFYIAEAGESAAYSDFASNNYSKFTHDSYGNAIAEGEWERLSPSLPNMSIDGDGWNVWNWKPGDTHKSFTGTGKYERFRYRVMPYNTTYWIIEVESCFGDDPDSTHPKAKVYTRKIETRGVTDTAFQYTLFSNVSLSEFTRGQNQNIYGKVHSNGNIYFLPHGTTLKIKPMTDASGTIVMTNQVTSAGNMIRYQDAWGRSHSGTVYIANNTGTDTLMSYSSTKGSAFDSYHKDWTDSSKGALSKWGGMVMDSNLGAGKVEPPKLEAIEEGGYYNQLAENGGLVISEDMSSMTGITKNVSFKNMAENRTETVIEIDMSKLTLPVGFNGVIYCNTPVRMVNAHKLPAPMTIVSNSTVYTKGDFNKIYGNKTSYDNAQTYITDQVKKGVAQAVAEESAVKLYSTKQPAAVITSQRIYHLSKGFDDSKAGTIQTASDPALYTGDTANQIEINSALVDGPPTVDEINYVKEWAGVTNSRYNPTDRPGGNYCWANSDDFLENLGSLTVKKRGSIVHLENCNMASLDNSDAGPGVTAWTWKTHYSPPTRDYGYDLDLLDPAKQPPEFPTVSKRLTWKVVK